jgi:hypothetical protein
MDGVVKVVVVALHDEPRDGVAAHDTVQHDQVAVQWAVVCHDLTNVVRTRPLDDHQVAGVVEGLHADPGRHHVTYLPGGDRRDREKDQQRRDGSQEASPQLAAGRGTLHLVPLIDI